MSATIHVAHSDPVVAVDVDTCSTVKHSPPVIDSGKQLLHARCVRGQAATSDLREPRPSKPTANLGICGPLRHCPMLLLVPRPISLAPG